MDVDMPQGSRKGRFVPLVDVQDLRYSSVSAGRGRVKSDLLGVPIPPGHAASRREGASDLFRAFVKDRSDEQRGAYEKLGLDPGVAGIVKLEEYWPQWRSNTFQYEEDKGRQQRLTFRFDWPARTVSPNTARAYIESPSLFSKPPQRSARQKVPDQLRCSSSASTVDELGSLTLGHCDSDRKGRMQKAASIDCTARP